MSVMYSSYGVMIRGSRGVPFDVSNIVNIVPIQQMVVVDKNGYIGYDITNYFEARGGTYSYNYAILDNSGDYSQSELGQVTFYTPAGNVIGGREYRTVVIGGVEWMAENLDFKFSGLAVGQSGTSYSELRGNYYNNDEVTYGVNGNKYGLLYNWVAVKYLEDNKSQLIPGWHVPSKDEWDALATAVGGSSTAGTKLKSTTGWSSGSGDGSYGFDAFPAGYYDANFNNLAISAFFWTSTENLSNNARARYFNTDTSMNGADYYRNRQYSVRLVKDS